MGGGRVRKRGRGGKGGKGSGRSRGRPGDNPELGTRGGHVTGRMRAVVMT